MDEVPTVSLSIKNKNVPRVASKELKWFLNEMQLKINVTLKF